MGIMAPLDDIGRIVRGTVRGGRSAARRAGTASRWIGRNVGTARNIGGAGNVGMMRLLDLHAASCAGDTMVTIGLAGTIFFAAPTTEARGRVALYLLVTMVPFALLAPLVGPLLDRFRHGRRFALSASMAGRAVLAWVIASNIGNFELYPAAFGLLVLSRTYGVARSAAVPRLLPPGLGLSQAGARASVYGTAAGAVAALLGTLAFVFGPQWPLRLASVIFLVGAVVALNLPPTADSDTPEVLPKAFHLPWRHRITHPDGTSGDRILHGRLVIAALVGSAGLRMLYGFLLLFLAFAIREGGMYGLGGAMGPAETVLGITAGPVAQLAFVGGAFGLGTFTAHAIGTSLRVRRPIRLQAVGLSLVAVTGMWASLRFSLGSIMMFCLATAVASGLAKLSVDASIQERIPEQIRASAFAHAETLLMLAWVAGAAIGLVPFVNARVGLAIATIALLLTTVRTFVIARRLRAEILRGRPAPESGPVLAGPLLHAAPDGTSALPPARPDGRVTGTRSGA
jgi:MFS family permease